MKNQDPSVRAVAPRAGHTRPAVARRAGHASIGAAVVACMLLLSCFSDRPGALAPTDDSDCVIPGSAVGANRAVVLIRGFAFVQDTLRVRAGTTVTWVNCEAAGTEAHTSTSDDGAWDSSNIGVGESYAQTFNTPGTWGYFCRPHPFMRGAVVVE